MRGYRNKKITVIALAIAVIGLSIGFAVFSSTLNISSRASISPTGNFSVLFASRASTSDQGLSYEDDTTNYPVYKTSTGLSTADNPTIDNTGNPTISNLNVEFTAPGQSVTYTLYVVNDGAYDAYLTNLTFNNAAGASNFKDCSANASSDNPASNASSVCNNINLSVKVGSENPISVTSTLSNHLLTKSTFEEVIVTISYTGEVYADGAIDVTFGDIELEYRTIDEPIAVATSEPIIVDDLIPTQAQLAGIEPVESEDEENELDYFIVDMYCLDEIEEESCYALAYITSTADSEYKEIGLVADDEIYIWECNSHTANLEGRIAHTWYYMDLEQGGVYPAIGDSLTYLKNISANTFDANKIRNQEYLNRVIASFN